MVPAGIGEGGRIVLGEALAQRGAEGGQGERLRAQQLPRPREDGAEIDAGEGRPHLGMGGQLPVEDGPEQRPEAEAVVGREEMDGAADRGDPNHLALDEQRSQVGCVERLEARPEARVRVRRHLRLQPDELVHRRQRVERRTLEEQLPLQRRSVERPRGDRIRHVRTLFEARAAGS